MLIYIHTPIYKNSKHLPHLVEHCVVNQITKNSSSFLNQSYDIEGDSFAMYTVFFIPNHYDIDLFLRQITSPIDKESIKYEQKIIRKELEYYSYHQKLYENASKQIYPKKINNTETSKISFQEAINYHKKHYHEENIIICDDEFNILKNKSKQLISYHKETYFDIENSTKKTILSSYTKTNLIFKEYKNRKDYYFMFFLEVLLETWWQYIHRQKGGLYIYKHQLLALMPKHILLSIPAQNDTNINEDFFQEYKKYFLKILELDYGKKGIILNALIIAQYVEKENISKFIKSIDYQETMAIFHEI